jgi:hypothetical protein
MRHPFFVVLIGLVVSTAALAQTATQAPAACALREPDVPRAKGLGTIIGIQDAAVARADIPLREARRGGAIDAHYLNDLRVIVRQDGGIADIFDVPTGMTVHVGDRVRLQGSYRSSAFACSYIPVLAVPNDGPAV